MMMNKLLVVFAKINMNSFIFCTKNTVPNLLMSNERAVEGQRVRVLTM